jgi:hypothetical protein
LAASALDQNDVKKGSSSAVTPVIRSVASAEREGYVFVALVVLNDAVRFFSPADRRPN